MPLAYGQHKGESLLHHLISIFFRHFGRKKAFVFFKNLPYVVPENKMVQEAFSWESYNEAEYN